MPVIIPPTGFDMPAIIRIAAHSPNNAATVQRPATTPLGRVRPADALQNPPSFVGPTPSLPPQTQSGVAKPADTVQFPPSFVGPLPSLPPK